MTFPRLSAEELRHCVARLPRVALAHLPTPLEEAPRFTERLGGPRIYLKRDDCTGMLLGGNKTRHNEFLMADALRKGADLVVWGAGVQSNNCRQTAAACAKLGLACHLVLSRHGREQHGCVDGIQGNLLIDYLVGATVEQVDPPLGPGLDDAIAARAEEFRARGKRVYAWDRDVVKPRAAVSYILCLCEIVDQLHERGLRPGPIYGCAGGSTGAGLALAKAALGLNCPLRIIAPIRWPWDMRADMAHTANAAAELIGLPHRVSAGDIEADEDFVGPGYGIPSPAGQEALRLAAQLEGILLDPVYTAKALAAVIAAARARHLPVGQPTVFIHTGGTPALFAYRDAVLAAAAG
jgi:1-aminocyclopropane-1-carboxylate deaminase/D-cysteine desulfhydrase-like pyridoxal-dependent ACC family enzyme